MHAVALLSHIQQPVIHTPFQDNIREALKLHKAASRSDSRKGREVIYTTTHSGEVTAVPVQKWQKKCITRRQLR